jgi:hypothetical protein
VRAVSPPMRTRLARRDWKLPNVKRLLAARRRRPSEPQPEEFSRISWHHQEGLAGTMSQLFSQPLQLRSHPTSRAYQVMVAASSTKRCLQMTVQVFEVHDGATGVPLTILADDEAHARSIYAAWVRRHEPSRKATGIGAFRRGGRWLAVREQLADLARAGRPGVAYWLGLERGWTVRSPEDKQVGDLAPYKSSVRFYRVEDNEGEEKLIFARSSQEALTMFVAWCLDAIGEVAEGFTIRRVSRWTLTGPMLPLREQMDAEIVGVAGWSLSDGWNIYPFDHPFAG